MASNFEHRLSCAPGEQRFFVEFLRLLPIDHVAQSIYYNLLSTRFVPTDQEHWVASYVQLACI